MPLFINEGRLLPFSNVTGVRRSRFIPQNISLVIAFESKSDGENRVYKSEGTYLSLAQYDEWNVEKRCWGSDVSCTRDLIVYGLQ